MSTHATIAYREPNGSTWVGVYNHSDGDTVGLRLRRAVAEQGADAVRDLIAGTPQGFSFFDPTKSFTSLIDGRTLHEPFKVNDPTTIEHGFGLRHSRNWGYTCILELDGSVTELGPVE